MHKLIFLLYLVKLQEKRDTFEYINTDTSTKATLLNIDNNVEAFHIL